jgi:hypothetical protein
MPPILKSDGNIIYPGKNNNQKSLINSFEFPMISPNIPIPLSKS